MAMKHQISSNVYDRYHSPVKARELHSQKQHEHGNMRAGLREEGSKPWSKVHDGFDRGFDSVSGGTNQLREKIGGSGHRHGEIDKHDHNRRFDNYDFAGHDLNRKDSGHFPYGNPKTGFTGIHGHLQGPTQIYQFTQITITHSSVFSGAHLGSPQKINEAHQNFLNAALSFIKNPSEQAYKSLNDAMTKLMDPKFTAAAVGGAAGVSIRGMGGTTMVKFTMEVTPAPTKSLEEAREDLKNAYSSKRNGEKGIAGIREEAYANYIRALSEKFKQDGVISHTNHTPTTPVYKSSVIYITKVTQVNVTSLREIKTPKFGHNLHGKLSFKNPHSFWNGLRQNHKSYVDMLKHDSKKPHTDRDFKPGKSVWETHDYRRSGEGKTEKTGHRRHNKAWMDKAS